MQVFLLNFCIKREWERIYVTAVKIKIEGSEMGMKVHIIWRLEKSPCGRSHGRPLILNIDAKTVEGLLTKGGLKADDRPLWFDVYRTFPPFVEPKFAKPKPEIKPIRQILYQEDAIRAKFHSKGLGLGTVNMLNPNSESQTKRLVNQYQKLESEGIPEEELIEKSVAMVENERQENIKSKDTSPKNPASVTTHVLADADLKNIFSEK